MTDHDTLISEAKVMIEYISKETVKQKDLKKIVKDLREKLTQLEADLNDTDSVLEDALDKVVDKVDDYIPFAGKKFVLTTFAIVTAIVVALIWYTY